MKFKLLLPELQAELYYSNCSQPPFEGASSSISGIDFEWLTGVLGGGFEASLEALICANRLIDYTHTRRNEQVLDPSFLVCCVPLVCRNTFSDPCIYSIVNHQILIYVPLSIRNARHSYFQIVKDSQLLNPRHSFEFSSEKLSSSLDY